MKKNRIYVFVLLILAGLAVLLYYQRGGSSSIKSKLKAFSVEDTASIDKIVLSDKTGKILTLTKKNKIWYGADSIKVRRDMMNVLLETIKRVEIKSPVNKPMRQKVMKDISTSSIQVEIYSDGSLERKYFVGGADMTGTGTFMLLEDGEDPFINHIPGFDGYLTVRFNTNLEVWKDREIFRYAPNNINIIQVEYPQSKEMSFNLKIESKDYITLFNNAGDTATTAIDGEFLRQYLIAYSDVQYESQGDPRKINFNEILNAQNLIARITVYDKDGKRKTVEIFKRYFDGLKFLSIPDEQYFDADRCFVRVNNKTVYNAQYWVFNKLIVSYKDFFSTPIK